ncbi:MAG TPA: PfkB family carbohydrate kinase, partial [Promineifilum sp.]|nr:PfkB family carbohydrate kinase [Promineifilum sp.]
FGEYRAFLDSHGIDTSAILDIEDEFCASFFVNTDEDNNQIASFYTGAMAYAGKLSFARYAPDAELTIITPNDPGAMRSYIRECKSIGLPFIYDPSQQTARISAEEILEGIDGCYLLSSNEYEFQLIQEKTGLSEAEILDRAGGLVMTMGPSGSRLVVDGREEFVPVAPTRWVAEPTGAGDAYRAGLMRGMQLGLPWGVAGRMGALAAAYVLEQSGPQNHYFTREEFVARYRESFDDEGALDVLLQEPETIKASAPVVH